MLWPRVIRTAGWPAKRVANADLPRSGGAFLWVENKPRQPAPAASRVREERAPERLSQPAAQRTGGTRHDQRSSRFAVRHVHCVGRANRRNHVPVHLPQPGWDRFRRQALAFDSHRAVRSVPGSRERGGLVSRSARTRTSRYLPSACSTLLRLGPAFFTARFGDSHIPITNQRIQDSNCTLRMK